MLCVYVRLCVCAYVCMCVCAYLRIGVCVYVRMCSVANEASILAISGLIYAIYTVMAF